MHYVFFVSEEDRQWFMEAMQGHTIDSISRMKQISQIMKMPEHLLDSQGVTTDDLEGSFTFVPMSDDSVPPEAMV